MTRLRRFAPTAPAEWPWNGWPNAGGIAGRMLVEQVAEWRGMRTGRDSPVSAAWSMLM
jgi:hypothetical protein